MNRLIDHLAELTGQRDRDVMDATLASVVNDLVRPRAVGVYRAVGEDDSPRWATQARISGGKSAPIRRATHEELPRLADFPQRFAALSGERSVASNANADINVFPLSTALETGGVLEVVTDAPLRAEALATVTGILRIFRNCQTLLDYSERDSLTGLLNRKTFDDGFFKVIESVARTPLARSDQRSKEVLRHHWLAMVDIDFFKAVNDTYGHLIGDEVLLLMARLMRGAMRSEDHLYRFGGEEFVIAMPCGSEYEAEAMLERLRRKIETYPFPQVGRLTISVGFTMITPTDSPSSALERADRAVYYAKENGRNQVCSHQRLLARGEVAPEAENVGAIELF